MVGGLINGLRVALPFVLFFLVRSGWIVLLVVSGRFWRRLWRWFWA